MNLNDYHCSGSGVIAGGEYGKVSVSGAARATGDVTCEELHCSGGIKAGGNLCCKEMHVSGGVKIAGDLTAGTVKTSGSVKTEGNVEIEEALSVSGSFKVEGDARLGIAGISGSCGIEGEARAKEIKISGSIHCGGNLSAERFACSGKTEIPGLLNAETIEISASGRCEVGDIGCGSITVQREWSVFGADRICLKAESIEGDTISLENTEAEVVRGKNVTIGRRCEIGRVEYSETLEIVDGGKVGEQVRV